MGFRSVGNNVLVSRKCSIYGAKGMSIGDHVRIDDFCLLSGNIEMGSYIHIPVFVALNGGKGIKMEDFTSLSARVSVISASDDMSGDFFSNPTLPEEYRNVKGGQVVFEKHTFVGTGTIILPNLTIGEGVAVGAASLVDRSLDPWKLYVGVPCRAVKLRSRGVLDLEKRFRESLRQNRVPPTDVP